MKKFLLLLTVLILATTFTPVPVLAEEGLQIGSKIVLDTNIEAEFLGKNSEGDYLWRATIGGPKYLEDLVTPIEPWWNFDSGKGEWFARTNLYTTIVKDTKVTTWYEGKKLSWQPDVYVGTKKLSTNKYSSLINQDPINENYWGNTLQWTYGDITRNLRIIEGMLIEYYTVSTLPSNDIKIIPHSVKDLGFVWTRPSSAWDAEGKQVDLIRGKNGELTLTLEAMQGVVFPITIDPDTTFTSSSSDGTLVHDDWPGLGGYASVHDASTAKYVYDTSIWGPEVGQRYEPSTLAYVIWRGALFYNTSGIPDNADIDSATLKLYGMGDNSDTDFTIQIQDGTPTYPHDPMEAGDYLYSRYSGNGGTFNTSGWNGSGYNSITLSGTGLTWIDKTGTTKLFLRSSRDIASTTPTGDEMVSYYMYEYGVGYRPQLEVTYSASAVPTVTTLSAIDVAQTSATLRGYLNDDGGAPCDWQFQYYKSGGTWTDNQTVFEGSVSTGYTASKPVVSLDSGTLYYFRVQFRNDEGTTSGDSGNLTTESVVATPSDLIAVPSSYSIISLKWTKSAGSSNTEIRGQKGSYPTTYTDGTQVYFGPSSTTTHTGLNTGETWYYRIWGESGGNHTEGYDEDFATTYMGEAGGDASVDSPTLPSNWFTSSSPDKMVNLPFYGLFNSVADDLGMSHGAAWLAFGLLLSVCMGAIFLYTTGNLLFGYIGVAVTMVGCTSAEILPGFIIFAYLILGGYLVYSTRGTA